MMLSWHFITSDVYKNASASEKTDNKLFFLSDTGEIYRGTQPFTESVVLYTSEPEAKAVGKLYINSDTLEGKIWTGSAWFTVIHPVVSGAMDATNTTNPVSGKAIADYVSNAIKGVTGSNGIVADVDYSSDGNKLVVTLVDGSKDIIPMSNVAADLVYDKTTGKLQVKNAEGTTIGTGINLDLERFVKTATFDPDNDKIILTFNDDQDPLEIPVGGLVDTYTAANSTTIKLTVTGNEFVAEAIVSTEDGNMLQVKDTGLFVAAVDISGKADKVAGAVENNLAALDAEGNLKDSGVKVGGSTIAEEGASSSTLATEAAVAAIRSALAQSIAGKMAKVGTGHAGEILTATENGEADLSGIKVGGETFAETPNAATVATEKGVESYVGAKAIAKTNIVTAGNLSSTTAAASDEKVASEKALIDALTWKTTV